MQTIIIHSQDLSGQQIEILTASFGAQLQRLSNHHRVTCESAASIKKVESLRAELQIDINILPEGFDASAVRLLITDMDSTLINIECVDEIADFVGVKSQVAAITESAMRGEIDFSTSLTQRVALLKGLDISALKRVYQERLQLNPGAETMIAGLKSRGVRIALVSGGFTFFTEQLKSRLGLDFTLANVLAINNGKLEGSVEGDIVDAATKEQYLTQLCQEMNIESSQAIAMGDGANDLKMLGSAGLGVAYHAKPAVCSLADVSIQYKGLDAVLDFFPEV